MKTSRLISAMMLLSLLIITNYCTSDKSKNKEKKPLLDLSDDESIMDELNYFRFPSPEEIFSFVQNADIEFVEGIVNDIENFEKYNDSKKQTLNLGVYISDLAYFTMFKQQEETYNYLNTVHKLTNAIKIEAAFSYEFLGRVHNNLYEIDSLVNLSSEAYKSIVTYLESNKKENTLALLSVGTYVESLHLSLQFITDFNKDKEMVQRITDQKYAFENLYMYCNQHLDYEKDAEYIQVIKDIKEIFDSVEAIENKATEIKKTDDGKLVFGGGSKLLMSEEIFNKLKGSIEKSRNLIIL